MNSNEDKWLLTAECNLVRFKHIQDFYIKLSDINPGYYSFRIVGRCLLQEDSKSYQHFIFPEIKIKKEEEPAIAYEKLKKVRKKMTNIMLRCVYLLEVHVARLDGIAIDCIEILNEAVHQLSEGDMEIRILDPWWY